MELSYEEAKSILSDSKNPYYADFYHRQKPDVVNAVHKAFEVAHPGESEIGGDLPGHINEALNTELGIGQAPEAKPGEQPPADDHWAPFEYSSQQTEQALRKDWGVDFERNLQKVQGAISILDRFPDTKFVEQVLAVIGGHPSGPKLLLYLNSLIEEAKRGNEK